MLTRRHFTGLLIAGSQAPNLFAATRNVDDILLASMQKRGIPAVAALATDANRVLYSGGFGKRDTTSKVAVTPDSIFQIASMTKPIASVAAMQLVEQGKASLDAPVSKYLPQLANPQVLVGFDAAGDPILRPAKGEITLRQLLTHASGMAYGPWHSLMARYAEKHPLPNNVVAPLVPLVFDPGTNWQYGYSTDWTGRFIEAVSGMNLQQYLRKNVLDPLDMRDTEFGIPADKFERSVNVFRRDPSGKFESNPRVQPPMPTDFNAGGGLSSTVNDYAKFARMIMRYGLTGVNTEILKARTVEMMIQNQIGNLRAGLLKTNQPGISADVDTNPGSIDKWGLGFLLHGPGKSDERSEGSLAWAGIYNTYFWIDMRRGIAGVIMMQYLPFFDREAIGILGDFERAVYTKL